MTNKDDIDFLKAEIDSLTKLIKSSAEKRVEEERKVALDSLKALTEQIGEEFDPKEYADSSVEELNFGVRQLEKIVRKLRGSGSGDMAKIHDRGDVEELSGYELEDALIDMISLAFNLPIPPDEIKEEIRYERMSEGYFVR
jgi:hypothetical protein